jgi:hypothetical protein
VRAVQAQRRILATVTVLHGVIGAAVATAVPGPLLAVDDLAYLSMGRTLAGGGAAPLGLQPPYGFLYPLLLAPGWALGLDESQMIVWARLVNAGLGALLVPVLYLLVRKLTSAGFATALGAALVGASLPAALLTGSIVWTERLLPLLVAVGALMIVRLARSGSRRAAAGAIAAAVGLYAAHPRMGLAALVLIAAVVAGLVSVRNRRAAAVAGLGGVGGMAVDELLRRALATASFGDTGTYDVSDLVSRRGLGETPEMVIRGLGTVAYLVLATAGLAVLGFAVLLRSRELRVWYLGMLGAVVLVAGWFLVGVERADAYLQGRYIEVMAPLLVALGVIGARELAPRLAVRLVAGAAIFAGLYGAWAGPGDNWARGPRSPVMMLGTEVGGAPFGGHLFEPGAAATVAVIVGVAMIVAARARSWMPPLIAAAAITVAVLSGIETLDQLQQRSVMGQVQAALADADIAQITIDADRVPSNLAGAVAWEVGFDRASTELEVDTTHLLLPADAPAPIDATLLVEFVGGSIWSLG